MEYTNAVNTRRSEYMLDDRDVLVDDVVARLRSVAGAVPSSYNSQSARMFVLSGGDHRVFWAIVEDVLRARVDDEESFRRTKAKLDGFSAAAGTILFYEIDSRTEELIGRFPIYSDMFTQWAEHGNAMLQFASWVAICDMGLGVNIQHYNPIIDERVAETFGIPDGYRLIAQMVFGKIVTPSGPKAKLSGEDIVTIAHAKM